VNVEKSIYIVFLRLNRLS